MLLFNSQLKIYNGGGQAFEFPTILPRVRPWKLKNAFVILEIYWPNNDISLRFSPCGPSGWVFFCLNVIFNDSRLGQQVDRQSILLINQKYKGWAPSTQVYKYLYSEILIIYNDL